MESQLPKSTVYFDGSCPLCRAEIGYYQRNDQYSALCFVDISEPGGIPPEGIRGHHTICTKLHAKPFGGVRSPFRKRRYAKGAVPDGEPRRFSFQNPVAELGSKVSGLRNRCRG